MKVNISKPLSFFLLTALSAVLLFGSCTDDLYEDGRDPLRPFDPSAYPTCFSSVPLTGNSPSGAPRRISTDYNMKYWWTFGDRIWINVGDSFLRNDTSDIPNSEATPLVHDARFFFTKALSANEYEVRYTGNGGVNGKCADSVHITAVQTQTSLGAAHVGQFGDCGIATATRKGDSLYTFDLDHKASFLLFTPRVADESKGVYLRSIKVTKLNCTPGDSALAGSYYFDADGLHTGNAMKNPSKTITLNLFTKDKNGKEIYPIKLSGNKNPDSCLYMVLQPGNHKIAIEYEMVVTKGNLQKVTLNKATNKYEYSYTDTAQWKVNRVLKATAHTFTPNGFTKVSHKQEPMRFQIPHSYYEWGASSWIYNVEDVNNQYWGPVGNGTYPTNSNSADAANYEHKLTPLTYDPSGVYYYNSYGVELESMRLVRTPTLCLLGDFARYGFAQAYNQEYLPDLQREPEFLYPSTPVSEYSKYGVLSNGSKKFYVIGNFKDIQYRSIVRMPSANEMTYYLKYGDIHRDNTTLWSIDGYRGDTTMCRGGIWIKKRAVIEAEGHPFSTTMSAYGIDLRYESPGNNFMFRHYNVDAQIPAAEASAGALADVKYGIPANIDDYFFLPLMGYIYNVANTPGGQSNNFNWTANKGQYKFVGAEGYYWTRTMWPNAIVSGQTNAYNLHGEREAYYLRITPYWVGLAWDMRANRIHGMVGNQRPDRYKTMPESQRGNIDGFQNDWWFQ